MVTCEICDDGFDYLDGEGFSFHYFANGMKRLYFCSEECAEESAHYRVGDGTIERGDE